PALAVVLVRPHARPQLAVIGGYHAAFPTGGHDLVLAERPAAHVPDGADRPALVASPMGLGAVLDHMQTALAGQLHDRVHIAGPAGQVNTDDRPGTLGQHRPHRIGGNVL